MSQSTTMSLKTIHPRDLKQVVKEIPTLPIVYQELFSKMNNPDVSVPQLAEIVSRDQALAAKILKLVNSAFYGYKNEINTVNRAMVILGFRTIRNAALAISVFEYVAGGEIDTMFSLENFWRHSLASASICKVVGRDAGIKQQEETFVAGLLHDVGKLIMLKHFREDFVEVCRLQQKRGCTWLEAENELLRINHTKLARAILRSWNFPPNLIEAVSHHHDMNTEASYPRLVALVNLSDQLTYHLGIGSPASIRAETLDPAVSAELGMGIAEAMVHRDRIMEEIDSAMKILNIIG